MKYLRIFEDMIDSPRRTLPVIPPARFTLVLGSPSEPELSAPSSFPCITFFIISWTAVPGFNATSFVKKFTCVSKNFYSRLLGKMRSSLLRYSIGSIQDTKNSPKRLNLTPFTSFFAKSLFISFTLLNLCLLRIGRRLT